jgi:hypothetical protein
MYKKNVQAMETESGRACSTNGGETEKMRGYKMDPKLFF